MTRSNNPRGQPPGGAPSDDHDLLNGLDHAQLSHELASAAVVAEGRLMMAALYQLSLELGVYPDRKLPAGLDHIQDLL
jgi:hypothetical protein